MLCQKTSPKRWFGKWTWRQIVSSQIPDTKYKWPWYTTEWNPYENFLRTPLVLSIAIQHMHFHPFRMNLLNLSPISKTKIVNIWLGEILTVIFKYHEQSNVTNFVDSLASCGCISLINKPTTFRKKCTPSLLDHIYINICDEKRINNAGITIYDIFDHLPVFVNFKLHHPTQQKIKFNFGCMKHLTQILF